MGRAVNGFSAREFRAIRFYCKSHSAVPQLTIYPQVRVKLPDGRVEQRPINELLAEYDESRQAEAKERNRIRRQEQRFDEKAYRYE
jgi:hypothetical protein